MEDNTEFLVHILCLTYNHGPFIEQAMNGFVMQETNFPYVVIIIDDASSDENGKRVAKYMTDHFAMEDVSVSRKENKDYGRVLFARNKENKNCYFAVILLNENHHQRKKNKSIYYQEWTNTKYVALCEGDDYWTDPKKLQKQVDYLESHPDCMLTVHSADWLSGNDLFPNGCVESRSRDFSVEELIRCGGLFFATASFVFREEVDKDWPDWRRKAGVGDFPIQILSGLHGRVHYLPDMMCVYRYRCEGSWTFSHMGGAVNIDYHKNKIEWMTLLDEATRHQYQEEIYNQLFQSYNILFNNHEISFVAYAKAVHKSGHKKYGRLTKDFLRFYLTPVYRFLKSISK